MEYKKVDFALGLNRPKLKIDYSQLDFADAPTRLAFNQIDGHTIEAKIEYKGVTASGKFHFNDVCEMICFSTDERGQSASDGTFEYIPWEAQCQEYKVYSDGIKRPTIFRAVWKYPDQDFVYFDGKISSVDGVELKYHFRF